MNTKIFLPGFLLVFLFNTVVSQITNVSWLSSGPLPVESPGFIMGPSVNGEEFENKNVLSHSYISLPDLQPLEGDNFLWNDGKNRNWGVVSPGGEDFIEIKPIKNAASQLAYLAVYIESPGLYDYTLEVESLQAFEILLDGGKLSSSYEAASAGETSKKSATLKLDRGKFLLVIKSLHTDEDQNDWKIKASFSGDDGKEPVLSTNPAGGMDIHHLLEGTKLSSVSISPDGSLLIASYSKVNTKTGETARWTQVKEVASGKILQSFRKEASTGYRWMPAGKKVYYTLEDEHGSTVWVYDFSSGEEYSVLKNIEDLSGVSWSDNEELVIYGISEEEKEKPASSLKYMDELGNRTFRTSRVTSLYSYDASSGVSTRLTYGEHSTGLEDISRDATRILFSISKPNDTIPPFSLQSMYLMDLASGRVDTLWKDFSQGGSPQFSPDGKKLLVVGGPECFGDVGKKTGDEPIAMNYDQQLYIYDLSSGEVESISEDFNPAVSSAEWHPVDGRIYVSATDEMYVRVFVWEAATGTFTPLITDPEVIGSFSLAAKSLRAVYTGNNTGNPSKAWLLDIESKVNRLIDRTEADTYEHVRFGKSEEWDFTSSRGVKIRGYIIYPLEFDPQKKYPLIVNYYGGVSPVSKSFGGRYPQDIWACEGYVVYVPQPSGAIGFGQEFSARHQNNWGITVADEIIEGTQQFLAAHPFVDADRVGCIGASYGGFMTMLLQTRTDIFACAISHAGISSISSYWGEGYWGYWYNTVASRGSYPWNRKDIYVDQSPLFSADKVNTPLLLLHGSKDTNVPLGESLQLWVGLKILGKPVEMVQVEGEDHHILTYSKRIEWHNTIMAWFDKWLKDTDHDWKKLFPESKL